MQHRFAVSGMTCAHCVRAVTEAVHAVDPAATTAVDLPAGAVLVETPNDSATRTALAAAIEEAGYTVG